MLWIILHKKTTDTPASHRLTLFIAAVEFDHKKMNLSANRKAPTALYKTEWRAVVRRPS